MSRFFGAGGTPPHFWGRGAGFPSNIMWPEPRPTRKPTFILIRVIVWPQYTKVTDRQTGQTDNGLVTYGDRFTNGRPKMFVTLAPRS